MKKISTLMLVVFLLVVSTVTVMAADGFMISLHRDFGYGGFGNQIQGTFSLNVEGEHSFDKVIFMMDGIVLGEDSEAPFKVQFSTDNYDPGEHVYWAQGIMADGTVLESNRITAKVLSKEETGKNMFKIVGILVGGIAGVALVTSLVTGKVSKGVAGGHSFEANGIPEGYSTRGGSICPKCGKPFSFHFWSLNLVTHKGDRCPNCGKFVFVKPISYRKLEEILATQPEKDNEFNVNDYRPSEDNSLKKKLDDSKYMD